MTGAAFLDLLCGSATTNGLLHRNYLDTKGRATVLLWLNLILKDLQNRQQSFHWRFLEVGGTLSLVEDTFNYDLVTAFSTIEPYKVLAVYDKTHDYPLPYVDYSVFRQVIAKETASQGNPTIWSLNNGDICLYPVTSQAAVTGTTTSSGLGSKFLHDNTATFITDGVQVGMKVTNSTDGTSALVTVVNSEIKLTLDTDIMDTAEAYSIADIVYVDYIKNFTALADSSSSNELPAKYDMVLVDGVMALAYRYNPTLGNAANQQLLYESGVNKMIQDNQSVISEINQSKSHRSGYRYLGALEPFPLEEGANY